MRKKIFLFYTTICIFAPAIFSQTGNSSSSRLKELELSIANAKTQSQKSNITAHLGRFYLENGDSRKADSIWNGVIQTAQKSGDKSLLSQAYKDIGYEYLISQNKLSLSYLQKAVEIATTTKLKNEEIFALQVLGYYYISKANYDKALEIYNQVDLNDDEINDSTRCEFYTGKSDLYLAKGEMINSFKNLFKAKTYAEKSKSPTNIRYVNRLLSGNYINIKSYEKALSYLDLARNEYISEKNYQRVSMMNIEIANIRGLMGQPEIAEKLFVEAIHFADSTQDMGLKMQAIFGLYNLYPGTNKKLTEFEEKYKISDYLKSIGNMPGYYSILATNYDSKNQPDSFELYVQKAVAACDSVNNPSSKILVLISMGNFYRQHGNKEKSLNVLLQSLALNDSLKILTNYPIIYTELDSTYFALGDFNNAYKVTKKYQAYRDSLDKLSKTEDILREEIAFEEENIKRNEEKEIKATAKKHNIQYTAIIIGGIILLITLLTLGFFNTPNWVIRLLGFVSFIFLFEFIILLLDSKLHHWFHGAPLPILGIKVLIACLLVPLHHLTEKKVIRFLQSKKLHRLKTVFKDEQPAKT